MAHYLHIQIARGDEHFNFRHIPAETITLSSLIDMQFTIVRCWDLHDIQPTPNKSNINKKIIVMGIETQLQKKHKVISQEWREKNWQSDGMLMEVANKYFPAILDSQQVLGKMCIHSTIHHQNFKRDLQWWGLCTWFVWQTQERRELQNLCSWET